MNKDLILREKLAIQRTHLANQATFLAFFRTSLYLFVAGLSTENVLKLEVNHPAVYALFGLSPLVFLFGVLQFFYQKRKIDQAEIHVGDYKEDYEG